MVDYSVSEHLCLIRMNDPGRRNALGRDMLLSLAEAFTRFESDPDAWVAVLAGEGKLFCAGADLSFFTQALEGEEFNNMFLGLVNRNPLMTGGVTKPVVVAMNGPAIGGGVDIATKGDFIIADEEAYLLLPESELGNVLLLWEGLPVAVAKELACGFRVPARRAYELGLFNRLAPTGQVEKYAISFARELLGRPPLTIRRNVSIMNSLRDMAAPMPRKVLMDYCAQVSNTLAATSDSKAAMEGFLSKNKPVFTGK